MQMMRVSEMARTWVYLLKEVSASPGVSHRACAQGCFMPFHFGGHWQGKDLRAKYLPELIHVLGEALICVELMDMTCYTDAGNKDFCVELKQRKKEKDNGTNEIPCDAERCIECNACAACKMSMRHLGG